MKIPSHLSSFEERLLSLILSTVLINLLSELPILCQGQGRSVTLVIFSEMNYIE